MHNPTEFTHVEKMQVGVLYMIAPYVTIIESYVLWAMLYRQCSAMKLAIKIIDTSRLSLLWSPFFSAWSGFFVENVELGTFIVWMVLLCVFMLINV